MRAQVKQPTIRKRPYCLETRISTFDAEAVENKNAAKKRL